jgi:Tn3 transposase DDE domain
VEAIAPRAVVLDAIAVVEELVPEDGAADTAMRVALAGRYNTVRPFLTPLGESSALRAAPGGERVLAAVQVLPELARRRVAQKPLAPTEIDAELVTAAWRRAGPLPRYFGYKRGKTWLNAVNDQVAGIGQMVVPGTPRDSLHILDTLLNLDAGPKPEVVTTDTASYSDMIFGLFALLGYQFSPRFADLPDQRYWRAPLPDRLPDGIELSTDQAAITGYGPLEPIARAGSLVTNQVRGYDLPRMFGRDGHPTPLGQGFIEYGRIAKYAAPTRPSRPDR